MIITTVVYIREIDGSNPRTKSYFSVVVDSNLKTRPNQLFWTKSPDSITIGHWDLIDVRLLGIVTLDSNKATTLIYGPILQSPTFVFVLKIELNKEGCVP